MSRKILLLIFMVIPMSIFSNTIWLDQLDVHYMCQDWGTPQVNKSVLGTTLTVAGKEYYRGIGTHSISRLFSI